MTTFQKASPNYISQEFGFHSDLNGDTVEKSTGSENAECR